MTDALVWVRIEKYCEYSGEPINTVLDRIRSNMWAAQKHYKRTGPRTVWVNLIEANKWVAQQPHVEAAPLPRGLKSAKACVALACA